MFRAQRALVGQVIDWLADPIAPEPEAVSTEPLTGGTTSMDKARDLGDKSLIDDTGTPAPSIEPDDDSDE